MTTSQLFIPDRINVGFQKRQGTYTGKLAYVIYWDKKNVLRKEKSWNSWRDKKIEPQEFKNEPIEGFVLNKKVGGYKSDWNFRQSYVRVYDPRDFEFEISVENLLFILENCSAIKGKGLEGQFVYSWSGTDLVLLPVDCENYKKSTTFTDLQAKKLSKKDLVAGNVYRDKKQRELLYIGRHDRFLEKKGYNNPIQKTSKEHVFVELKNGVYAKPKKTKDEYHYSVSSVYLNFEFGTAVNELVSEKHPQTAEATQDYWECPCGSKIVEVITKPVEPKLIPVKYYGNEKYKNHWVLENGVYKAFVYYSDYEWNKQENKRYTTNHTYSIYNAYTIDPPSVKPVDVFYDDYDKSVSKTELKRYWSDRDRITYYVRSGHFDHHKPLEVTVKLESGTKMKLEEYLDIQYHFNKD
jgi:hypothetical protein